MPGKRMSRQECLESLFHVLEANMHGIAFCSYGQDVPWTDVIGRVGELTGWSADEFRQGKVDWADLVHPDDIEAYRRSLSGLVSGDAESATLEYRILDRHGGLHWVTDHRSRRVLEDGTTVFEGLASDSTRMKMASSALDRGQNLFQYIAERSPVGIIVISSDARITYLNRRGYSISGLAEADVIGQTVMSGWEMHSVEGASLPLTVTPFTKVMVSKQAVEGERIAVTFPNGRKALLSVNAVPITDETGAVQGVLATFDHSGVDVQLLKSEQFARAIIDESPLGISVRSRFGQLLAYNKAWQRIWAIPEADVRKDLETPRTKLRLDERDGYLGEWSDAVRRVYQKGGTLHIPELKPTRRRPKSAKCVSQHFYAIPDAEGNVDRVVIITEDTTAMKETMEALRESEERYRSLAEAAQDMIFVIDRDDNVKYVNTYAAKAFGVAPGSIIGRSRTELFDPVRSAQQLASLEQVFRTGKPEYRESETEFPGGSRFLGSWLVPLQGADGNVDSVLGISRDITDRIKAIKDQRELESRLALSQKLESIGRLAGGIAHDFNNLLTVILGRVEVLQKGIPESDQNTLRTLAEVTRAAERARDLTGQLLAFGRKQMITLSRVDLNSLITSFSTMLHRLIGEDIEVVTDLAPALRLIRVDPTQIEQVLMNLCINARDAMPSGGRITLRTSSQHLDGQPGHDPDVPPGDYAVLAVSDSGTGMDEETVKRIFDPFFTTKEVGKGTGLGLAMVYGIVKQHGGQIRVTSEPGKGSTFTVYLPVEAEDASDVTPPEPMQSPGSASCPLTGTVLVVEDDEPLRKLMCEVLGNAGFAVIEVAHPEDAARLASSKGPVDLLLSDIVMPVMGGMEVRQQVLRVCPDAAVLFISGYSGMITREGGSLDDGVCFLQKPFSVDSLVRKAREAISSRVPKGR